MSSSPKKKEAKKQKFCLHESCKSTAANKGFCRLHYIAHWRELKAGEKEKSEKRLNAYVNRMAERYPKDYMERIKENLEDEEKFQASVDELGPADEKEGEVEEVEFLEKFLRDVKGDSD